MQRIVKYGNIELLIALDSAPDFDGVMVGLITAAMEQV